MKESKNSRARWGYLLVATTVMMFLGLIYAWSVFRAPLNALFPIWTPSVLSLVFTLSMVFFCSGLIIGGIVGRCIPIRTTLLCCAVLLCGGMLLVSSMDPERKGSEIFRLYIGYSLMCGGSVGVAYNTVLGCLMKWFPEKGGLVSGVLLMGFGFGSMLLGVFANALITTVGVLKAFTVLAFVALLVVGLGAFFVKSPMKSTETSIVLTASSGKSYTPAEMLQTPTFWIFFLWNIVLSSAGLLVINSAVTIAVTYGASATMGLLMSVFNGGGRLLMGAIFDKHGRKIAMTFISILLLFSGIILMLADKYLFSPLIVVGMLLVGVSYGGGPCMGSAVINQVFGPENYSVNFSLNSLNAMPAAFLGPMISSELLEASQGNYTSTFVMITVLAVITVILNLLLGCVQKD